MSFSATVRRVLISCPGDVPQSDLEIVRKAINRWNVAYGPIFSAVVIPVSWGLSAAAEFGQHPQSALNDQLVDECDMCIALFANRLGTPTPNADSGTVEEIERLHEDGRYVAILRSSRPVDTSSVDVSQLVRVNDYLSGIRDKALVLGYADDAQLHAHVDAILHRAVSRDTARAELQLGQSTSRAADVWPRIVSDERVETDSRGRIQSRRLWYLVVANGGDAPARDVRFDIEPDEVTIEPWHLDEPANGVIKTIAPNGDVRFRVTATMGSPLQALCTVWWTDDLGERQNSATLRLA